MRLLPDLVQGSEAWLAWRKCGLGASDAAAILGLSPWVSARELWEELTGRKELPRAQNYAMRRGQRLEPKVRRWYEARYGVAMPAVCAVHSKHPWLRASLDGFDWLTGTILEAKAPDLKAHRLALADEVPEYYWPQVQHQLFCTGSELLHYVSYSENKAFAEAEQYALVEVRPDPDYQAALLWEEWLFWGKVQLDRWEPAPQLFKGVPA
jgi:putative phage-type endonuclease